MNKVKILHIDMDPSSIEDLITNLHSERFDVISVTSVKSGLQVLNDNTDIPIVVCNTDLPNGDIERFLSEVKSKDINIPIIITSSSANPHKIVEFTKKGIFDFFLKPIDFSEFKKSIELALEEKACSINSKILQSELDFFS